MVATLLDDWIPIHHNDDVGVTHGREPVRLHHHREGHLKEHLDLLGVVGIA
jgi:hypothetical protein